MNNKAIIYYSDVKSINRTILYNCYMQLVKAAQDVPIYCVLQEPVDFMIHSRNILTSDLDRSGLSLMKQIVIGCHAATNVPWVYLVEHDILYPKGYFEFTPEDSHTFYYNDNNYIYTDEALFVRAMNPLSQVCCGRRAMISAMNYRIYKQEKMGIRVQYYEPGKGSDFLIAVDYRNLPTIDIRHKDNFTGRINASRHGERVDQIELWGNHDEIKERIYRDVQNPQ